MWARERHTSKMISQPRVSKRPQIVVLGLITRWPVAGPIWEVLQYLIGLDRLGYDAYYVEAHRRAPRAFMTHPEDDGGPAKAAAFLGRVMGRYGFDGRWAYQSVLGGERHLGLTEERLRRLYRSAALIINLNGGTEPLSEHSETGRLVYLETDPGWFELGLARGDEKLTRMAATHRAFSTYGLNLGGPECRLPMPDGIEFHRTPPPVLLDLWRAEETGVGDRFTTVGNWRFDAAIDVSQDKRTAFLEFLDLPGRTSQRLELALGGLTDDERRLLESHGWHVRSASEISEDLDTYRRYIRGSAGEFTVARDEYVRFRTGWFSERSAAYLAAGNPVIMQDTGFGEYLPTGEGLFSFSTMEDVVVSLDAINSKYARHSRAAQEIAREFLDANVVLPALLDHFGLTAHRPRSIAQARRL
jgi:hypothetical protein